MFTSDELNLLAQLTNLAIAEGVKNYGQAKAVIALMDKIGALINEQNQPSDSELSTDEDS